MTLQAPRDQHAMDRVTRSGWTRRAHMSNAHEQLSLALSALHGLLTTFLSRRRPSEYSTHCDTTSRKFWKCKAMGTWRSGVARGSGGRAGGAQSILRAVNLLCVALSRWLRALLQTHGTPTEGSGNTAVLLQVHQVYQVPHSDGGAQRAGGCACAESGGSEISAPSAQFCRDAKLPQTRKSIKHIK